MAVVLCTGNNPVLMQTRRLILEAAGHSVITATRPSDVVAACKEHVLDVAIVGQSYSANERKSMASMIRQHAPSAKILELYQANQNRAIEDADSWLEVPAEVPQELAQRVEQLAGAKPEARLD